MFAIPVRLSPRVLYGPPDELAPDPNKECLKSLGLGLPSTTIGGQQMKQTKSQSPAQSPLSKVMATHKSFLALSPVTFPVFVAKKLTKDGNAPVPALISRKLLSYRQPCSLCGRTVDVHATVVLLACSHIAHMGCYDELVLNNKSCLGCEEAVVRSPTSGRIVKRKKRTMSEQLLYSFCCMWSWR